MYLNLKSDKVRKNSFSPVIFRPYGLTFNSFLQVIIRIFLNTYSLGYLVGPRLLLR